MSKGDESGKSIKETEREGGPNVTTGTPSPRGIRLSKGEKNFLNVARRSQRKSSRGKKYGKPASPAWRRRKLRYIAYRSPVWLAEEREEGQPLKLENHGVRPEKARSLGMGDLGHVRIEKRKHLKREQGGEKTKGKTDSGRPNLFRIGVCCHKNIVPQSYFSNL